MTMGRSTIPVAYSNLKIGGYKKVADKKKTTGFKNVQKEIAEKGGYDMKTAGAILAKKTRDASPKAKKANPKLRKVKG